METHVFVLTLFGFFLPALYRTEPPSRHFFLSQIQNIRGHKIQPCSSPSHVVIACDVTKDRHKDELKLVVNCVRMRGDILRGGDTLLVLGVLHRFLHPMGYKIRVSPDSFAGTNIRAMEEEVSKKVDMYVNMLLQSAEECEDEGVNIEVKVIAGNPMKKVILQEVMACNATWVVLDRHLRRDLKYYLKQIPCKVAFFQDNLSVDVLRPYTTNENEIMEHKHFYSACKPVPILNLQEDENIDQSVISCASYFISVNSQESSDMLRTNLPSSATRQSHELATSSKQEKSGTYGKGENSNSTPTQISPNQRKNMFKKKPSKAPILCAACGTRSEMSIKESMRFSFQEIQVATNDFAKENFLGEGGYGHVYKGELRDGQMIAAKVHKEASTQGFTEFHSEVYVLSFARHKNIIMLLGYCCKENINILVYEYICNKSLEWHLFENTNKKTILEWHQRHAIAIGTAKGLRFLHEECRGGPIIHRDMRPSNILLTHDYVPMLGDFGLAKWRTSDDPVHTTILGTLGYLAPEYAENGIVSVRTDVYAFGIVLLQLISGRKVVAAKGEDRHQSLRLWAAPLIERLALHELIDPRIGDLYDMHQLYLMARTSYLCVQSSPELRPSMGEVVRLLEGESDHFRHLSEQFLPHYIK